MEIDTFLKPEKEEDKRHPAKTRNMWSSLESRYIYEKSLVVHSGSNILKSTSLILNYWIYDV